MNHKYMGLVLILIFVVLIPSVMAQSDKPSVPPDEYLPGFSEVIEVHLIPIHVLIRDRKGNPITGLTRDDFIVYEDNKEQVITHFAEVQNRKHVEVFTLQKSESGTVEEIKEIPGTDEMLQEQYIFYIDNLNIHPLDRNRVLAKLNNFVEQRIHSGTRGMVVMFDRSLHVLTPFTDDAQYIKNMIDEQKERTGTALNRVNDRRDLLQRIEDTNSYTQAVSNVRGYASDYYNEMVFTLEALSDFLTSIKGTPGRKILIYVSSGLPETPGYEIFHYLTEKFPRENPFSYSAMYDLRSNYRGLVNTANSAGVSLCMMDVTGLRGLGTEGAAEARYTGAHMDVSIESHNLTDALQSLSESTGGVAIINTNDFEKGFEKISSIVDNYYFLGYQRSRPLEDRFHKLKVELKKKIKGATITHKNSFLEKSVHSLMGDKIIANLVFPAEENPMEVEVKFDQPYVHDAAEGQFVMPMEIKIPFRHINLALQQGNYVGRLRIGFAARGTDDRSEVTWKYHDFSIPRAAWDKMKSEEFIYSVQLVIRGGASIVSVGVMNEFDRMESYRIGRVFIRPPQ